ncbi:MAG: YHYH protein, partial [Verrucomicrobiota bacterium]
MTVSNRTVTGDGAIGYYVNGVAMFDSRDDFSYSNGAMMDVPNGGQRWNRDAWVNELPSFDAALAHQANGQYHYHANPPALRYQLGDRVDFNPTKNTYPENFNGRHSPILGWNRDGLPLYGPYGYSDPMDSGSGIRRMISGYRIRTGLTLRNTWPDWATRLYANVGLSFRVGPDVGLAYPLGRYMEDNDYKGDLGLTHGVDFDLNEFNVRYCLTPEFPGGTWAYFVCIEADGTPVFPYNIGRAYFGEPTGGVPDGLPDSDEGGTAVTTHFEGGPEKDDVIDAITVDSDDITLTFSVAEGGRYEIQASPDLGSNATWAPISSPATADWDRLSYTASNTMDGVDRRFFRTHRMDLADFDDNGFVYDDGISNTIITVSLMGDGGQGTPPNLNMLPDSVSFNGLSIDLDTVSRPSQQEIRFEVDLSGLPPGTYNVVAEFPGMAGTQIGTYTIPGAANRNILLLIVDDWGVDSSPMDNSTNLNPGTSFPNLPNLESLAALGVRFVNGYAQPVCSPTRAAIMTGRQAWRTGVGAANDSLQNAETALPEAFAAAGSPYALASFGKWHLGGGNPGYRDLGGWPEFVGLTGGGAQDYYNWPKNDNGTVTMGVTNYTTSDQVNEAIAFIDSQDPADNPWFVWMGFNAPHTPFHEPPAELLQGATGSSDRDLYEKALEALDTE